MIETLSNKMEASGHSSAPETIEAAQTIIYQITRALTAKPFRPHRLFRNGHAQTLIGYVWPRRFNLRAHRQDAARLFVVEPQTRVLAYCRWQKVPGEHPTMILVHGLEGSSESVYILSTAHKAYQARFNVLRLNIRNCGGTEHLTPTLYNSGITSDLRAVAQELIERDHLTHIFLVGFSLGGNVVLKLAGESGESLPREIAGVCAVSPSLDLSACAEAIERRSNRIYQQRFMKSLQRRMRDKQRLFPERYDISELRRLRTIRDFDERYTAIDGGYRNAADYYARASALPLISRIRRPTLILHAQDDPFIPFHSFRHPSITDNPHLIFIAPPHGGHVGFVADDIALEDRFWAENRVIEFCSLTYQGMNR